MYCSLKMQPGEELRNRERPNAQFEPKPKPPVSMSWGAAPEGSCWSDGLTSFVRSRSFLSLSRFESRSWPPCRLRSRDRLRDDRRFSRERLRDLRPLERERERDFDLLSIIQVLYNTRIRELGNGQNGFPSSPRGPWGRYRGPWSSRKRKRP